MLDYPEKDDKQLRDTVVTLADAPQTAQNFITLARRGYFNGLQVHRVVPNFVVQDGDPRGDGDAVVAAIILFQRE